MTVLSTAVDVVIDNLNIFGYAAFIDCFLVKSRKVGIFNGVISIRAVSTAAT